MHVLLVIMVVLVVSLWLFGKVAGLMGRTGARIAGHRHCTACGRRLAKARTSFGYATTCGRCGAVQPWASSAA